MKQLFLAMAICLAATTAAKAQASAISINNMTSYTVYLGISAGIGPGLCTGNNRAILALPPGITSYSDPSLAPLTPLATPAHQFYHARLYNYDPTTTCYVQQSVNVGACGFPGSDVLDIYDVCTGGTLLPVTIDFITTGGTVFIDIY